jgi:hypothetical protein
VKCDLVLCIPLRKSHFRPPNHHHDQPLKEHNKFYEELTDLCPYQLQVSPSDGNTTGARGQHVYVHEQNEWPTTKPPRETLPTCASHTEIVVPGVWQPTSGHVAGPVPPRSAGPHV